MDLSTKLFGNFCVACALAVVGVIIVVTLATIVWVTLIN